jgi:hypothetical protein
MNITFNSAANLKIAETPLSDNDYVGAFYKSFNTEKCLGYIKIADINQGPWMIHGGQEATSGNLQVYFKFWKQENNCIVYNFSEIATNWDFIFVISSSVTINGMTGKTLNSINYTTTAFCQNNSGQIIPVVTPADLNISFSYPDGLAGDNKGRFTPSENKASVYTIRFATTSDECLNSYEQMIIITNSDTCSPVLPPSPPPAPADTTNNSNIISPYSPDASFHNIEIKDTGIISIYNYHGNIVRQLNGPAIWDGTDYKGELLPSDEYYLQTESGKHMKITVIR